MLTVNETTVSNHSDVQEAIQNAREHNHTSIKCTFATIDKVAMHPQEGIPLMYYDQLNIIAKHLADIKLNDDEQNSMHQKYLQAIEPQIGKLKSTKKKAKLTRRILKSRNDWYEWQASEYKQLQQYEDQGMFSEPQPIPPDTNCLPFMWNYMIKDDGTKKARAPCNGSPRMKGTVTFGETYAASLEQTGAKIFWSVSATSGNVVIGADASNAFAEAPAPVAPLYMKLDQQFHSWWKSKGRPPIPNGYGVKVHKAIQGHPESPRLWASLINKIIVDIGFRPCKHEPCLYYHPNYNGEQVYFLR